MTQNSNINLNFRSDIELLRVISAFGIVWFHSEFEHGKSIAYAGLIFFIVLSVYLCMISRRTTLLGDRAKRLLIPWFLWYGIYGFASWIWSGKIFNETPTTLSAILSSPSIHLWYLPFIFIALLVLDWAKKRGTSIALFATSIVAFIVWVPISDQLRAMQFAPPLAQYIHAIPALLVGVMLGTVRSVSLKHIQTLGLFCLLAIYGLTIAPASFGLSYTIGVAASLVLISERSLLPQANWLIDLGKYQFGIYLVHVLILSAIQKVAGIGIISITIAYLTALSVSKLLYRNKSGFVRSLVK